MERVIDWTLASQVARGVARLQPAGDRAPFEALAGPSEESERLVGAYTGLRETQQTAGSWDFPLWSSRRDHATAYRVPFTVTGPSCDSSDTMFVACPLPSTLATDDRLYIGSAGAYTLSYASSFNGFPPPRAVFVGRP